MPPTIAGTPAPGTPGAKQMPKWAWPVAIGGGLLIGFFFLRKPSAEEYEGEDAQGGGELQKRGGGGGGGLPPELMEALGLEPPSTLFYGAGSSATDGGGSGDTTGDAPASDTQTSLASQLPRDLFYNPTQPASSTWTTPWQQNQSTYPTYTQGAPIPTITDPFQGMVPSDSAAQPRGGGSGQHLAQ